MPDYKEMYLHLMRETEKAIRILTAAQQACEEMYLRAEEGELVTAAHRAAKPPSMAMAARLSASPMVEQAP